MFKPDSIKKKLFAVETFESIKVDGILDEKTWGTTPPSPVFTQVDPGQGELPNHLTSVKVIFDKEHLYFGVFCADSLGKDAIRATDFKRDFNFQTHDLITLCIDGFNDERNAMSFAVNPYGVQRDYLSFDALYYDIDWDAYWRTRTTRTDSGWVAEIALPWKTLRYPESTDSLQSWGFQLYRNRRMTYEISAFSEFPRSFGAARMDYAGKIENLNPPPPSPNIRVQPYFLTSVDEIDQNKLDGTERSTSYKLGGDIKWAINSNDVLDLTVNTDFAQADVDRQINNTSRFSVFFPERRQFFLENASLFGINVRPSGVAGGRMRIQPFFSRTIGLDDEGRQLPIEAGARFVHRSTNTNFGGMFIRQASDEFNDATNFFVGRFSDNFGKQNRIGGLVTLKNQPDGSSFSGTFDSFLRFGEPHSLSTLVSFSGSDVNDQKGLAGISQYYYSTNKWKAWWTQSYVSGDYNPEMGFVSRSNVIGTTPGVIRYFRGDRVPLKKWIRAIEPSVMAEFYHDPTSMDLIERKLTSYPLYFTLQSGGYLGYGFNDFFQRLTQTFSPLGVEIQTRDYNYFQHEAFASTDQSKKVYATANFTWGTYFNGEILNSKFQLFVIPTPHVSLGGKFDRINFQDVGVSQTDLVSDIVTVEGRFAANPRLQMIFIYQQNTQNDLKNVNLRFSWEYRPLSYLFLVYNHRDFQNQLDYHQIENQVIGKISFLKQF